MLTKVERKTFTIDEYHQMAELGVLKKEDRLELIEGDIVHMAAIGSVHAACVNRLNRLFNKVFPEDILIGVQNPVILDDFSEPEPDLSLLKARKDFYAKRHPTAEDIFLIVEVADSSMQYDQEVKLPLYAQSGIPEVWIIDLNAARIDVYTHCTARERRYKFRRSFFSGETVSPSLFPTITLPIDGMIG